MALNTKGENNMPGVKRRDHKGRILWTGESQNSDGRYVYKDVDIVGDLQNPILYPKVNAKKS